MKDRRDHPELRKAIWAVDMTYLDMANALDCPVSTFAARLNGSLPLSAELEKKIYEIINLSKSESV